MIGKVISHAIDMATRAEAGGESDFGMMNIRAGKDGSECGTALPPKDRVLSKIFCV